MVTRGIFINMVGLAATLAGVQALVGMLVAKTLQVRRAGERECRCACVRACVWMGGCFMGGWVGGCVRLRVGGLDGTLVGACVGQWPVPVANRSSRLVMRPR